MKAFIVVVVVVVEVVEFFMLFHIKAHGVSDSIRMVSRLELQSRLVLRNILLN